jgi:transposase InsO family protein
LAKAGIEPSVSRTGDSYDNALAETVIGLFKTEEIHRRALEGARRGRVRDARVGRVVQR